MINNYDPDSKESKARRAAKRARDERADRAGLIALAEGLATAFNQVDLVTRCGLTSAKRTRIRAALVEVNEHPVWAK